MEDDFIRQQQREAQQAAGPPAGNLNVPAAVAASMAGPLLKDPTCAEKWRRGLELLQEAAAQGDPGAQQRLLLIMQNTRALREPSWVDSFGMILIVVLTLAGWTLAALAGLGAHLQPPGASQGVIMQVCLVLLPPLVLYIALSTGHLVSTLARARLMPAGALTRMSVSCLIGFPLSMLAAEIAGYLIPYVLARNGALRRLDIDTAGFWAAFGFGAGVLAFFLLRELVYFRSSRRDALPFQWPGRGNMPCVSWFRGMATLALLVLLQLLYLAPLVVVLQKFPGRAAQIATEMVIDFQAGWRKAGARLSSGL